MWGGEGKKREIPVKHWLSKGIRCQTWERSSESFVIQINEVMGLVETIKKCAQIFMSVTVHT